MIRQHTIENQDLEYYTSLYTDTLNDLMKEREETRRLVLNLLLTKLPPTIEDLLPLEYRKLLRIPERFLTVEEKETVREIREELDRIADGECPNGNYDQEVFKLQLPGLPYPLCTPIARILESGLINEELMLGDVEIVIAETGEKYRYPLLSEEVEEILGKAYQLDLTPDSYPQLEFKHLMEAKLELDRAKSAIRRH